MKILRFSLEVFRAAVADVARRPLGSLLSIAAMTVALALLGSFLVLMHGVSSAMTRWTDQAVAEVYLEGDATPDEIAELERDLRRKPFISHVEVVSRDQALSRFREMFPEYEDIESLLGENPFPVSLRLGLENPNDGDVEDLLEAVSKTDAVSGVRYDREWIESLGRMGGALTWFALGGSVALLLAALVTVGSVVRLALDDKREEVRLMRLVGAPVSFVVAPILLAGGLLGVIGGLIAIIGIDAMIDTIASSTGSGPMSGWGSLLFGARLAAGERVFLVLLALAAGSAAAGLAAGREAVR